MSNLFGIPPLHMLGIYPNGTSTASLEAKCTGKNKKNWFDYITKYVTTTDGAGDLFGVVETGLEYLKKLPLKLKRIEHIDRVQNVANVAGSSLVFSDIISGINKVRKLAFEQTPKAMKAFFIDGFYLIGDIAKGAGFMHENKLVNLGKTAPVANGVYNVGYLFANSLGVVEKRKGIKENKIVMAHSRSELEKNYLSQKNNLKMLKIVQKISSIALSIIGLGALFVGYNLTGAGAIPSVVLTFSTVYLILHITNYFYGKIITDRLKP
ncbi:MAG TPA: hypothetical protein VLG49_07515 [Rhabdochlamydiaceae bacterium]|nr:hypothetical protein [Rhabdochlamydiaceae bacterium]